MGKTKLTLAAMAAAFVGTGATATSVSIDSITANFGTPTPAGFTDFTTGVAADGTASIFWGEPADTGGPISGYQFAPNSTPFTANAGDIRSLGTFTHFNFPIQADPGSITGVPLTFSFSGTPDGATSATSFPATFNFEHDETTNSGGLCPGDPVPCSDIVSFTAVGGADEVVVVDDIIYTFTVLGFGELDGSGDFDPLNPAEPFLFITTEGEANSTDLFFTYSTQVIPLPAAGWLMLAGLGALGAVGRRRKKAA
ncbi:MAG: VPLPA-CTERM sorting domain-containing protein [Verrucomicrobia bacterium]|jgi:hypothetical protein|nr:VPLPA-CTERM sorting domain-containing protein [Verrucomicrobiota bacterium]